MGNIERVKELLKDPEVDINEADPDGYTPLIRAAMNGQTEVAKLLVNDRRCLVNLVNKWGQTAFLCACWKGGNVVRLMLGYQHIDVTKPATNGDTPMIFAVRSRNIQAVRWIITSGREVCLKSKNSFGKEAMDYVQEIRSKKAMDYESQAHYDKIQSEYQIIYDLLVSFENDPEKLRNQIRKEVGLSGFVIFFSIQLLYLIYLFIYLCIYLFIYSFNNFLFQKKYIEAFTLDENFANFRDKIHEGDQNSSLESAKTLIGIEPTYLLPLDSTSQKDINSLFFVNMNLTSLSLQFDQLVNLSHLNISRNNLQEVPIQIGFFFFFYQSKKMFFSSNQK
mgnify:CR=1 FL=1